MGIVPSDDSAVKQAGVFLWEEWYEIRINVSMCWIAYVRNVLKYIGNCKNGDLHSNM